MEGKTKPISPSRMKRCEIENTSEKFLAMMEELNDERQPLVMSIFETIKENLTNFHFHLNVLIKSEPEAGEKIAALDYLGNIEEF